MAKFAPVYMKVYDGADYSLVDLSIDNDTYANSDPEDTLIGTLSGMQPEDSVLSLADDGGGAVKLDGSNLVVGPTAPGAGSLNVTVRETNPYGDNSPHDTVIELTVT